MRILIDTVYLLLGVAISPVVIYRMARQGRYRIGWAQRFGKIKRRHPEKKCIWLHAVSVGEVNATKTIIKELKNRLPDFEILISTTTDTGFAAASKLYGDEHCVIFFPLDLSCIMQRAFSNIRPAICLLMELEVWPNFLDIANRLNVPVVVVNGRISPKSFAGYKKIGPISKKFFSRISLVLAQNELYAERFRQVGVAVENVIVTSSLKYDTAQMSDKIEGSDALAQQLNIGDSPLLVAGGTGNDEEKIILDAYKTVKKQFADLRLVIVPRKPERFDEVADLIGQYGFDFVRYSRIKETNETITDKPPVILGDTMGDLRKFYSLATVIFVGRSLVPMGGSDMIEAAALGKCTIFGPHTFNFPTAAEELIKDKGALLVQDQRELAQAVQKCLSEPDYAKQIAASGREIIRRNQGATERSIVAIEKLLMQTQRKNNL